MPGSSIVLCRGALTEESLEDWIERTPWEARKIRMFGKWLPEPRLTAWFGPTYKYAHLVLPATPFPPHLASLAARVSQLAGLPPEWQFNACLLNLYRDGEDHMGWHRDNEPEIDGQFIASLSFGASRDFRIRRRKDHPRQEVRGLEGDSPWTFPLEHGDLLIMENLQEDFEHMLPRRKRVDSPRLNLTFRRIIG